MKHINIKVHGRVQGVFFRAFTKEQAENLGIKGFATNSDDGCVYIEAEGEESNLKKLIKWCLKGPLLAKVEKVEVNKGTIKNYHDFSIA